MLFIHFAFLLKIFLDLLRDFLSDLMITYFSNFKSRFTWISLIESDNTKQKGKRCNQSTTMRLKSNLSLFVSSFFLCYTNSILNQPVSMNIILPWAKNTLVIRSIYPVLYLSNRFMVCLLFVKHCHSI